MKNLIESNYTVFLITLVFLSLILRLFLATLPGFKTDIDAFFAWAQRLNALGLGNFYSKDVFTDYTPGYLYVLYALGTARKLFLLDTQQFYFILKIPSIFAEVVIGVICFLEVYQSKLTVKSAFIISSFVLFNLALIFNSSIWGQVDSFLTIFLVLSLFFLKRQKYLLSSASLGLAFLIKPQAIAIMPIFLFFLFRKKFFYQKIDSLIFIILPFFFLVFILSLTFFPTQPLTGLASRIMETAQEYPYTSLFALNFWGLVGNWIKDDQMGLFNLSYQSWGYLLLLGYWLLLIYLFFKKNLPLYTFAALANLGFYFLPTRVHERYLYPGLVFLIFSAIELRSTFLLIFQFGLSLLYLASLYQVYIYYNYFYNHLPVSFYNQSIYSFIESNDKLLSAISTFAFIAITIYIIKVSHAKKNFHPA